MPSFDLSYPPPHALEAAGITVEYLQTVGAIDFYEVVQDGKQVDICHPKSYAEQVANEIYLDLLAAGLIGACDRED